MIERFRKLQYSTTEDNLFPVLIYEYDTYGRYGEPLKIDNLAGLNIWMTENLQKILQEKRELRITDMGDMFCFHVQNGEILYDGKNHYKPGEGFNLGVKNA